MFCGLCSVIMTPHFFMATLHNLELGTEVLSILSVVNIKLSIGRAEFA